SFDEESAAAVSDVHSFSWQRPSASVPSAPAPVESDEAAGSIFAKAKKRKEELEQARRLEAEALAATAAAAPLAPPTPEEEAEISDWPSFDEDEAAGAAAVPEAPAAFAAISGTLDQDMADLQLAPFSFEEESAEPAAPPVPTEPLAADRLAAYPYLADLM